MDWLRHCAKYQSSALQNRLKNVTEYYGITNRVSAVLHDNGSNVRTIAEGTEADDMPCAAHILQLVVKSAMKTPQIKTVITATSKLVGHVSYSAIASEALEKKKKTKQKTKNCSNFKPMTTGKEK